MMLSVYKKYIDESYKIILNQLVLFYNNTSFLTKMCHFPKYIKKITHQLVLWKMTSFIHK